MDDPTCSADGAQRSDVRRQRQEHAGITTETARKLLLARIEAIAQTEGCRRDFDQQNIDLNQLRLTVHRTRFYSVLGLEGELKFSQVVGKPALPDETLRALARGISADAFVLGYLDGRRYVRTEHVVLSHGYFEQSEGPNGGRRLTTVEEKQSLLLHELLHIALDKDDDDLNERELCPLRLLSFCPRRPTEASAVGSD